MHTMLLFSSCIPVLILKSKTQILSKIFFVKSISFLFDMDNIHVSSEIADVFRRFVVLIVKVSPDLRTDCEPYL